MAYQIKAYVNNEVSLTAFELSLLTIKVSYKITKGHRRCWCIRSVEEFV